MTYSTYVPNRPAKHQGVVVALLKGWYEVRPRGSKLPSLTNQNPLPSSLWPWPVMQNLHLETQIMESTVDVNYSNYRQLGSPGSPGRGYVNNESSGRVRWRKPGPGRVRPEQRLQPWHFGESGFTWARRLEIAVEPCLLQVVHPNVPPLLAMHVYSSNLGHLEGWFGGEGELYKVLLLTHGGFNSYWVPSAVPSYRESCT